MTLRLRRPARQAPTFLVAAMKDPEGGNLDRIQIVKGWVDAQGARQEKVYDVAWSGDRKPGADGKLPAVGNTVDLTTATYTNTIGAPELSASWKDPEFDPALRAVYYVRVLEIPTPRWTAYDAVRFKVKMPKEVRMIYPGARLYVADLVHAGRLTAGSLCSKAVSLTPPAGVKGSISAGRPGPAKRRLRRRTVQGYTRGCKSRLGRACR